MPVLPQHGERDQDGSVIKSAIRSPQVSPPNDRIAAPAPGWGAEDAGGAKLADRPGRGTE